MKIKLKIIYDCGCSVDVDSDGYGGIDASNIKLCNGHINTYNLKKEAKKTEDKPRHLWTRKEKEAYTKSKGKIKPKK